MRTGNQFEIPQQEDTEQEPKVTDGDKRVIETVTDRWWKVIEMEKNDLPTDEGQDPFKEIK